jgi:hypothetical protein
MAFIQDQEATQDARASEPIKIESHASKWNYPTEVVLAPNQRLHIVERRDTLWDLGQKYLGNPYAWPQIWNLNKWVEDPHWIYPGDPLIIPTDSVALSHEPEPDGHIASLPPDSRVLQLTSTPAHSAFVFAFHDYLQMPYLAPKGARTHFREIGAVEITGSQREDRHNLSKGEVVYLGGGQDKGLQVGDRMMVLNVAAAKLTHPDDRLGLKPVGDVIQHVATLRVLSVHAKNAEAVIEHTLDGIEIGQHATLYVEPVLIEAKDASIRTDVAEPIPQITNAKIIYGKSGISFMSKGSLVIIDKGKNAGLKFGDALLCAREKPLDNMLGKNGPQTNTYLGQMVVVKEGEEYSTCVITYTKAEMKRGDLVTE